MDADISLLYASRHFGDEDDVRIQAVLRRDAGSRAIAHVLAQGVREWQRLGRIPGAPHLGLRSRLCAPVRWHGELLAFVMVIDDQARVSPEEQELIAALADDAAPLLAGELESAEPAALRQSARVLVVDTTPTAPTAVRVDDDRRATALRHAVSAARRPRHAAALCVVRDGRAAALLAGRAVPVLGVGSVARWSDLGLLQVLLRIPGEELDETAVPEALRTLEAVDPRGC